MLYLQITAVLISVIALCLSFWGVMIALENKRRIDFYRKQQLNTIYGKQATTHFDLLKASNKSITIGYHDSDSVKGST